MENIEKIVSHYRRHQAGCTKRRAEIDGEIAKLQEERKLLNELRWTEGLIRPVMTEIARLTPEIEWEQKEEYHPMGLRCAVPVLGRLKSSGQLLGITFTELGGELFFDTERTRARFASGTLGEINGEYLVCVCRRRRAAAAVYPTADHLSGTTPRNGEINKILKFDYYENHVSGALR